MILARTTRSPSSVSVVLEDRGRPLSFAAFLHALEGDTEARRVFLASLRDAPFAAFCWETPPVTAATLGSPFEYQLVDSPALARVRADRAPFAEHFAGTAIAFPSLGGDAVLMAPCPVEPEQACAHLAAFVRGAPEASVAALWALVARTARAHVGAGRTWLSTAGLGVSWLHVRLDSRPKYYRTDRYRT